MPMNNCCNFLLIIGGADDFNFDNFSDDDESETSSTISKSESKKKRKAEKSEDLNEPSLPKKKKKQKPKKAAAIISDDDDCNVVTELNEDTPLQVQPLDPGIKQGEASLSSLMQSPLGQMSLENGGLTVVEQSEKESPSRSFLLPASLTSENAAFSQAKEGSLVLVTSPNPRNSGDQLVHVYRISSAGDSKST